MKKKSNGKMKVDNKTRNLILLVFATLLIISGIIFSRSRYMLKSNTLKTINSSDFYFNSYSLGENEKQYNVNKNIINLKVINFDDELKNSNLNIEYEIKCEVVSTTNSNIIVKTYINDEEKNTGVLTGNQKTEDSVKVEISGVNDTDNIELRISAIAKSPYSKKLSAVYNIKPKTSENEYDVNLEKETDYVNLLIRTYSYSGSLKINFTKEKLMIYSEQKDEITLNDGSITVNVNNNSNYSYKFIRLTSDTITLGKDIIVEK